MSSELLRYAGCAWPVEGLGPGRRTALWVCGCHRACPGCMAPELWADGPGYSVGAVATEVAPGLRETAGLTISGGEPFEQAPALLALLQLLRAQQDCEVLIYSGYWREELEQGSAAQRGLLAACDILIDGPYREEAPGTLRWRGSDNQRVHLLSLRAQIHAAYKDLPWEEPRPLGLKLAGPDRFLLMGIPRRGDLAALRRQLRERGFGVIPKGVEPAQP